MLYFEEASLECLTVLENGLPAVKNTLYMPRVIASNGVEHMGKANLLSSQGLVTKMALLLVMHTAVNKNCISLSKRNL